MRAASGARRALSKAPALGVPAAVAALIVLLLAAGSGAEQGPNPFIVLGVANGAIFGLVALGLVLVYKGTRAFNFLQGEFGTLAAFFMYVALDQLHLPWLLAAVGALAAIVAIGLGVERVVVRPLLDAPRITLLVATIALALLAIGIEILVFRIDPRPTGEMAVPLQTSVEIFGLVVTSQRLAGVTVLMGLGAMLAYFFARTDLGLAVLATSQDAFATRVVGIGVERMSRFIWAGAALVGGIAGILYVPIAGALFPGIMSSNILIPAITGAVLGGMTSLPGAFLGGVLVGVVQSVSLWASGRFTIGENTISTIVPGAEQLSILLLLLIVLLARPQGLLGREA